jgi:hypothetical protein
VVRVGLTPGDSINATLTTLCQSIIDPIAVWCPVSGKDKDEEPEGIHTTIAETRGRWYSLDGIV